MSLSVRIEPSRARELTAMLRRANGPPANSSGPDLLAAMPAQVMKRSRVHMAVGGSTVYRTKRSFVKAIWNGR